MIIIVFALACAAVTTALMSLAVRAASPLTGLLRRNHAGIDIPTSVGIALVPGFFAGLVLYSFLLPAGDLSPVRTIAQALPVLLLVAGVSLLGLIDDASADTASKGFGGHLRALLAGKVTTGLVKALGGGAMSLVFAFWFGEQSGRSIALILLDSAVLALLINMMNLLDLRPGRALKVFLTVVLFAIAGSLLGGSTLDDTLSPLLWAVCALALLRGDLGERHMLGDAGSNALGAVLGGLFILSQPSVLANVSLLILLVAVHIYAEKRSISALIERQPLLRAADLAGRKSREGISSNP